MKNIIYLLLINIIIVSCQTTKIKNQEYKISPATIELGNIGTATSINNTMNDFSARSFPKIENKIRLDIQILPFNDKINKIYLSKTKVNQLPTNIKYVDSLPKKPEFVTVTIMEITALTEEINASYNKNIFNYLKDNDKASIITSVALVLSDEDLNKLKQADTYYLMNDQDAKYTVALYKQGKKMDILNLNQGIVLAYTIGKFCWSISDRQQWYIADIVKNDKSCKGNTLSKMKKKEETNLFKL